MNFGEYKNSLGNIVMSDSYWSDKVLEKHGAKFLGVTFINGTEYHAWTHESGGSPIVDEINILKEELQQAYVKIDELRIEIDRQKKLKLDAMDCKVVAVVNKNVSDSWVGCVDRQGGSFDEYEIAQRNWESGW